MLVPGPDKKAGFRQEGHPMTKPVPNQNTRICCDEGAQGQQQQQQLFGNDYLEYCRSLAKVLAH